MEPRLANKLAQRRTLKTLRDGLLSRKKVFLYRNEDNIFYMLCQYDQTIGHSAGKKIHLSDKGWRKITALVEAETGVNLITDDIDTLAEQGRLENSALMPNEKALSIAPTQGFVLCRLLANTEAIEYATKGFAIQPTPIQSYLGVHIQQIVKWNIDTIIVIENFAPFTAFDANHLQQIENLDANEPILLIYRGHDDSNIYSVASDLATLGCDKYIFADYDLAGLQLAEVIAERIEATGYVLPKKAWLNQDLPKFNKTVVFQKVC